MPHLEHLIQESVSRAVVTTLDRATEKIAEDLAREILKDRDFRERMHALVKHAFDVTLAQLATDHTEP